MNLNGTCFRVSSSAEQGVVSSDTRLRLTQRGNSVLGRYDGGSIERGCLVGEVTGTTLRFRYAQRELAGHTHGGRSHCAIEQLPDGRFRLHEHFTWDTRPGSGVNVFDEVRE